MRRERILPVKGLDQVQAATYIGVSVEKFRELVERKLMPKPKLLDKLRRWDVYALDVYFNALPDDERSDSERAPAARVVNPLPPPNGDTGGITDGSNAASLACGRASRRSPRARKTIRENRPEGHRW